VIWNNREEEQDRKCIVGFDLSCQSGGVTRDGRVIRASLIVTVEKQHIVIHYYRPTDRPTDPIDRQTRLTDRQTDRQTDRPTD